MPTIAVDFDGVIHRYSRGWHDGTIYDELMPGAIEGLCELMFRYAVFIHTSRDPQSVADWLVEQRPYLVTTAVPRNGFWDERGRLLVTDRKLPALAYIDDRAIRFTDWGQTLAELAIPTG